MLKKIIFLFFALFSLHSITTYSQTILLEENPGKDTLSKMYGKNLKHYAHVYAGFAFATDPSSADSVNINYGKSGTFFLGARYKYKICNFYALGYDVSIIGTNYNIRQSEIKNFLDTMNHKKEVYHTTSLSLEFYNRFNFGKRGNTIGKFLDLGVYGDWIMLNYHFTKDKSPDGVENHSKYYETYKRNNNFSEPFNYGVRLRMGINRYTLCASYRLSNMFIPSHEIAELPRLFVGMQIGLF